MDHGAKHEARCRVRQWFAAGCVVMVDDGDDVVRLHGAGKDETMLFKDRATARLTRQGGREPAVGGYLSRKVLSVRSCRHQPGVD